MTMGLRTGDVELAEGYLFIVPRGAEHRPQADEEVHPLLVGSEVTSNAKGAKPDWSYDRQA